MDLTEEQRRRIELNRQKALKLREQKAAEAAAAAHSTCSASAYSVGFSPKLEQSQSQHPIMQQFDQEIETEQLKITDSKITEAEKRQCQFPIDGDADNLCCRTGVDPVLLDTFDEAICSVCKLKTNEFELLTKSNAATEYLLPNDVFKLLPYQSKNNPFNAGWTPMKLYLRKNLLAMALKRFGTLENIEIERKRREQKKYENNLQETDAIFADSAEEFRSVLAEEGAATGAVSSTTAGPSQSSLSSNNVVVDKEYSKRGNSNDKTQDAAKNKRKQSKNSLSNTNSKKRKALNDLISTIRGDA